MQQVMRLALAVYSDLLFRETALKLLLIQNFVVIIALNRQALVTVSLR